MYYLYGLPTFENKTYEWEVVYENENLEIFSEYVVSHLTQSEYDSFRVDHNEVPLMFLQKNDLSIQYYINHIGSLDNLYYTKNQQMMAQFRETQEEARLHMVVDMLEERRQKVKAFGHRKVKKQDTGKRTRQGGHYIGGFH